MSKASVPPVPGRGPLPRLWIILWIAVGASVVAVLLARPAYRAFRSWRIASLSSQAEEALAAQDYREARRLALSALNMKKGMLEVLETLKVAMEELQDPRAIGIARAIMAHPDSPPERKLEGFRDTCEHLPLVYVIGTFAILADQQEPDPIYIQAFASRLIDDGLYEDAASLLLRRTDLDFHPQLFAEATRLSFVAGAPDLVRRGLTELGMYMRNRPQDALPAFRQLRHLGQRGWDPRFLPDLDTWLDSVEGVQASDRLIAANARLAADPLAIDTVVEEMIGKYADDHPADVARWLLDLGWARRAADVLGPELGVADPGRHFELRAEALGKLEAWEDLQAWAADPPVGHPPLKTRLWRFLAAIRLGQTGERNNEWEAVRREAGAVEDFNGFFPASDFMEAWGLENEARDLTVDGIRQREGRIPLYTQVRHLLPWMRSRDQGFPMLEFCQVLAEFEPRNIELAVEEADLSLVFGKIPPEEAVARLLKLQGLAAEEPDRLRDPTRLREALALAHVLDGSPQAALDVVNGTPAETGEDTGARGAGDAEGTQNTPRLLAAAAAAHAQMGNLTQSEEFYKQLDWDTLLSEEQKIFREIRAKHRPGK